MGGGGEGERHVMAGSVEAASATAATCACVRESEHLSQNRKEKWPRRLQLGVRQEEDVLHRVAPGERACEMPQHLRGMLAGAALQPVVMDSVHETMAYPLRQSWTTSHSHSAPRTIHASVSC